MVYMAFNLVQHFTAKHNAEFVFMMIYYTHNISVIINSDGWVLLTCSICIFSYLKMLIPRYTLVYSCLLPVAIFDDANSEIVLALPSTENILIWLWELSEILSVSGLEMDT